MDRVIELPDGEDERVEAKPSDEIWLALAEVIRNEKLIEVFRESINAFLKNKPKETALKLHSLWLGYFFALALFVGIGVLAWLKVLTGEVTAGLLGSVIGYWFGFRQRSIQL